MYSQNKLSIIVPLYNAGKYLHDFFLSYLNQTHFEHGQELILIDNGSTDESKPIIEKYIYDNKDLDIKYYHFDGVPDSYAARNYGVRKAKGKILAFTDSDCILESNWVKNIYKNAKVGTIISGKIEIQVIDEENVWEVFDSFAHLNNKINASKGKVATANLIVMKDDFLKIGFFEERFSGGDYDWSLRAKNYGINIVYNERIKVFHPSRKTFYEIINKSRRMAYGAGVSFRNENKGILLLTLLYIFKFANIKTNIRHTKKLKKYGFSIKELINFNFCFMQIRNEQLKSAIQGYHMINARELGIK